MEQADAVSVSLQAGWRVRAALDADLPALLALRLTLPPDAEDSAAQAAHAACGFESTERVVCVRLAPA
ncbi:hypothetical protein BER93_14705 [Xanthomonas fragariae]|nr:hypothetical protein BER92_14670 [Xanthomonas fragariae]AOD19135.1 hypothetical protein BER93_14705 [Xanthomonas fragariae]ENZ95285.1 hypothetical protein O1K_09272 [Xanthomonas fragariae LMG 25863]